MSQEETGHKSLDSEEVEAREEDRSSEDYQVSRRASEAQQKDLVQQTEIQTLGKNLVSRLAMLFKTARIHSVQNQALRYSVKILVEASNALYARLGEYTLRGDVDSIFVDDVRIRPDILLWDNIVHLLRELADRGVGGLTVTGRVSPTDIRNLIETIQNNPNLEVDLGAQLLTERLSATGVDSITFLQRMSLVTGAQAIAEKDEAMSLQAIRTYTELLVTWKAYLDIRDPDVPEVIRSRLLTAIQNSVDMLHDEPDWFISTASFRRPDLHLSVQTVNTAVLALALGSRLDLTRKALMNLGMAAIYASAGLRNFGVSQSFELLKGGPASKAGVETYPFNSIKEILQTPALTRGQRDRIMVAYEHRMHLDGSGFPVNRSAKPKHLFSNIVTITARYVELTSDHTDHTGLSPTAALEKMASEESRYDRRLLRVFIRMLGPFPIGSVVQLTTGEVAVVFRQSADPTLSRRPVVKIVLDRMGLQVEPALFDLSERNKKDRFLAGVVRPLPASALKGLEPTKVVFAATQGEEEEGQAVPPETPETEGASLG
ncbi:MAG: HD domain-containing phosphohydrolase [Myxococcota bacterium]|nr:HD domain-containing phosphohydrolase [Myxococcota bacterium]